MNLYEELEKRIKSISSKKNNFKIVTFIVVAITFVIGSWYYSNNPNTGIYTILLIYGVPVIALFIVYKSLKLNGAEEIKYYKTNVVLPFLSQNFYSVNYDMDGGISEDVIRSFNLLNKSNRYRANDYIKGIYNNINFEMSDVYMFGDSREDTYDVFKGQWYIIDYNERNASDLCIISSDFLARKRINIFGQQKKISFDDTGLRHKYVAYSENENDELLSDVINIVRKIDMEYDRVFLCFRGNKLYIGIENSEDLFELDTKNEINKETIVSNLEKEVNEIKKVINIVSNKSEYDSFWKY